MFLKNQSLHSHCAILGIGVLTLIAGSASAQAPGDAADKESKLIAVLKSDAPDSEKAITCKRLAVYGSAEAVPVLAPFLLNEQLASWARIALEAIPGDAPDAAFRGALSKAHGRLLVGTINSIGVRRDTKAVGELIPKLKDADAEVASAAAAALGRIGGAQAASALMAALPGAGAGVRPSMAEGCIRCAEHLLTEGQSAAAIQLYDLVRQAEVPKQKKLEATRGAILARKDAGVPLLLEQLRSSDKALFQIGLRTARELPGSKATQAVADEMQKANADRQPLFLLALADRNDDAAMPTILNAAKAGSKNLRLTAIGILDRMGKLSSAPVLIEVAAGDDAEISRASLVALTRMPGNELDANIIDHLGRATGKTRRILIELAARRQVQGAIPILVKDSRAPDPAIRSAAVQGLGTMGNANQVNDLVQLLPTAQDDKQRQDIEAALMAISGRVGSPCAQYLVPLTHNSESTVRKAALHALASAGGPDALTAVTLAIEDRDESVQDEAVRTLSTWPNTWPEDEAIAQPLLNLARHSKKPAYQVLAMRGYLQFLQGDKKISGQEKLAKIEEALPFMTRPEEKRAAITVVQSIPTANGLTMLAKLAEEPAITEDACSAIVDLAGKNLPGVPGESRRLALQTSMEKSKNAETRKKATEALARIR